MSTGGLVIAVPRGALFEETLDWLDGLGVPTAEVRGNERRLLFEDVGLITMRPSDVPTYVAAGAADIILDPPSLVSAGRKKGVMSKIVANAAMGNFGWQLMVPVKSTIDVKDLNGKKVAITAAGSGSDLLALWTIQDRKIDFTRADRAATGADRIEARSTKTVERLAGNRVGHPRQQQRHARDVAVVFTRLVGAAEQHLVDRLRGQ